MARPFLFAELDEARGERSLGHVFVAIGPLNSNFTNGLGFGAQHHGGAGRRVASIGADLVSMDLSGVGVHVNDRPDGRESLMEHFNYGESLITGAVPSHKYWMPPSLGDDEFREKVSIEVGGHNGEKMVVIALDLVNYMRAILRIAPGGLSVILRESV